jgi:DNA-binding NtrC family response regulator
MSQDETRRSVLLVEDEYIQARHVSMTLAEMGCRVVGPFGSVREAARLIGKRSVDAALLDIKIGADSTQELAAHLDGRGVPVAVVTGYRRSELPRQLRKFPRLSKPYTDLELKNTVRRLLHRDP